MSESDNVPLTNEQAYELAGKILSGEVTTANGLLFTIYALRARVSELENAISVAIDMRDTSDPDDDLTAGYMAAVLQDALEWTRVKGLQGIENDK